VCRVLLTENVFVDDLTPDNHCTRQSNLNGFDLVIRNKGVDNGEMTVVVARR
jgi:hypothetical protein